MTIPKYIRSTAINDEAYADHEIRRLAEERVAGSLLKEGCTNLTDPAWEKVHHMDQAGNVYVLWHCYVQGEYAGGGSDE